MKRLKGYPRYVTPEFEPFDPLELTEETERIVTRRGFGGLERRYEDFYATAVYGGIATGYCIGCCFRCVFCWVKDKMAPKTILCVSQRTAKETQAPL